MESDERELLDRAASKKFAVGFVGVMACLVLLIVVLEYLQNRPRQSRERALAVVEAGQRALLETRSPEEARRLFLEAASIDRRIPDPHFNLGVLAQATGNWEAAIKHFSDFLERDRRSEWATRARTELLRSQTLAEAFGDRVATSYNEAVELSRRFSVAGDIDNALNVAQVASAIDPERWEAYVVAAAALAGGQRWDEADQFLGRAERQAPPDLRTRLAEIRRQLEDARPLFPGTVVTRSGLGTFVWAGIEVAGRGAEGFNDLRVGEPTRLSWGAERYGIRERWLNLNCPNVCRVFFSDDGTMTLRFSVPVGTDASPQEVMAETRVVLRGILGGWRHSREPGRWEGFTHPNTLQLHVWFRINNEGLLLVDVQRGRR